MRSGIRKRTFRYFLWAMGLIILIFSFFFVQYSNIQSRERFEEDHAFALRKTAESISHLLSDIQQNAYYMSCNDTLAELLMNRNGETGTIQYELLSKMFSLQLSPSASPLQNAQAALVLDPQFPLAHTMNSPFSLYRLTAARLYSGVDTADEAWYITTLNNGHRIHAFTAAAAPDRIFFSHQLRSIWIADQRFDEDVGVVIYSLPGSVMRQTLRDSQIKDGSVSLLMFDGRVLCCTDEGFFPVEETKNSQAIQMLEDMQGREKSMLFTLEGFRYAVSAQTVSGDWTVMLMVPSSSINQSLLSLLWVYAAVFGVLVLAALVLSMLFARRLVRPIQTLADTMQYDKDSQALPDVVSVPRTNDEIEVLYSSYNAMVESINQASALLQEKSETLRTTELKALQAQINPHFIYNTLDSVICIAMMEGQDDISTMVASLIKLLKYSVDFSQMMVTLREEIDYLQQYIQIQKLRYGDSFTYINEVSEKYHDVRVAKIVLQPLVENALFHAANGDQALTIRVWCEEEDGKLRIHVTDNGDGADAERLNAMLEDDESKEYYGIGIRNVNRRIRIMAGEGCGIRYALPEAGGLDAVVSIPITNPPDSTNS